jgi:hypothetical protein
MPVITAMVSVDNNDYDQEPDMKLNQEMSPEIQVIDENQN